MSSNGLLTKNFLGKLDGTFLALLLRAAFISSLGFCSFDEPARRSRRGGQAKIYSQVSSFRGGEKKPIFSGEIPRTLLFSPSCFLSLSLLSGDNLIPCFLGFSWSLWAFCPGWSFSLERYSQVEGVGVWLFYGVKPLCCLGRER